MANYYKARPGKTFKKATITQYRLEYILINILGVKPDTSYDILELGSGIGNSIFYLAKKYPLINFYGIEINKDEVSFCKEKIRKENIDNVFVYEGDATRYKFEKRFDFVFSEQVIEHVPDQKGLVNSMISHLKPDGKYFISTVSYNFPFEVHIKIPFITWLPKQSAIRLLNAFGFTKKAEYYKYVYPINPKGIRKFAEESGGKNTAYISHKIPLDLFSKNPIVEFILWSYKILFTRGCLIKLHENCFPWLGMIGGKK